MHFPVLALAKFLFDKELLQQTKLSSPWFVSPRTTKELEMLICKMVRGDTNHGLKPRSGDIIIA